MSFSHRVNSAYSALTKRQTALKQEVQSADTPTNQFIKNVADKLLAKHLRAKQRDNPKITFNEVRDMAIQWAKDDESLDAQAAAINVQKPPSPRHTPPLPQLRQNPNSSPWFFNSQKTKTSL